MKQITKRKTISRIERKREILAWTMILPALLLNVFIMGGPIVGTFGISLTDWDGIRAPHFIGLDNFKKLSLDTHFLWAALNNLKWAVFFLIVPVAFALIIAGIIRKVKRGQLIYRTMFFLPYIVTSVVAAKIWTLLYSPFYGITAWLQNLGISNPPRFLADPNLALYSVAFVDSWRYWVFLMVLFLTALSQVDQSIEEAAMIDGANKIQTFIHVTIPQIRPTISMVLILTTIWSVTTFDFVYLMTGGGPGSSSELVSTYMYRLALQNQQPGYASAISLVMVLFSVVFMSVVGLLRKRGWEI
ncbi:MAG: sugar ABC transporter permease [Lachnospiraceae bacterium]|nr:sugar ABC transporter permease [Lachnospiraceae bacterium]MDD3796310.1 sugar ABC transporter permease [Lachnospiraceae bacterium]